MKAVFVLVPNSISSTVVLDTGLCLGVLTIPGCEIASLFLLSQVPERAEWFDDANVVLTASSETLIASLDACRKTRKPPALTQPS
jgi:hypothetical protein